MDNLSLLKEQYAAQKEYELSQLKNAYDKNVQALDEKAAAVPAQYEAAKNELAVQNAIARKNFNEQAAATGLNSGTSGQAELARSNAYLSALSKLNRSEAETEQALERDRLSLQTNYQNAIAAQNAANEAELKSALYQEMVRSGNYGGGTGSGSGSGSGNGSTPAVVYDTHGYTTEQIKSLQRRAGIEQDGIWGPKTQAAYEAGFRHDVRTPDMLTSSAALNQAVKVGAGSYEAQLLELNRLYNNGQITEAQLKDLAYAITNPGK